MLSKREAARQELREIKVQNNQSKLNIKASKGESSPDTPSKAFAKEFSGSKTKFVIECDEDVKPYATKFSPNGGLLSMADNSGTLGIYDTLSGDQFETFAPGMITSMSWKKSECLKLTQKLAGAGVDGSVISWDSTISFDFEKTVLNEDNQYSTIDHSCDGNKIVLGGKLPQVEIYDEMTLKRIQCFELEQGHRNRIFTAKFTNSSPQVFYSGSWDRTVSFWDLRANKKTIQIHAPQICGESIDLKKDDKTMVIGSGELGQGIQLWDLRKIEKFKTIDWNNNSNERCPSITYCAFNKQDPELIVACASHEQPAKGFRTDITEEEYKSYKPFEYVFKGINGTCLAADMSYQGDMVAFGDSHGNLNVKRLEFNYQQN